MTRQPRMAGEVRQHARYPVLLAWLKAWEGPLPRMTHIATLLPGRWDAYAVSNTLRTLRARRLIDLRTGTRSQHKGHCALRVDGRELKTEYCPFDPPDAPEGWKSSDLPGSRKPHD